MNEIDGKRSRAETRSPSAPERAAIEEKPSSSMGN